jgi:hypothetical protein
VPKRPGFKAARLSDDDLRRLSRHPDVWKALRGVGVDAKKRATSNVAGVSRLHPGTIFYHTPGAGYDGHAYIELRAGSTATNAASGQKGDPASWFAWIIELGTSQHAPRPFMTPAVAAAVKKAGGQMSRPHKFDDDRSKYNKRNEEGA